MHLCVLRVIVEETAIINLSVFINRGRECLLRGTDWVFTKRAGYSFVLKGLMLLVIYQLLLVIFRSW
jgi:hypothetical protein